MKFADLADVTHAPGERRAALLLHAMSDADRGWLLANLPDSQRAELGALLEELAQMQIAPDPTLLQRAIGKPQAPAAPTRPATPARPRHLSDRDFLMELTGTQVRALAAALASEPALLVARCLQIQPWPWHEALLAQFHAAFRRQVQELLDAPPGVAPQGLAGTSLADALAARMRQCCEQAEPVAASPAAPPASALQRWPRQWAVAMKKLVHG